MIREEKKEIARIAIKCILAFLYLGLGFHCLFEVLFPKEEEEEVEEEGTVDNIIIQFRKREEQEHDAEGS